VDPILSGKNGRQEFGTLLVDYGALLAEHGIPAELVTRITQILLHAQKEVVAKEALLATEIDRALRHVRSLVLAAGFGFANKAAVVASINNMLTTPEPDAKNGVKR